MNKNIIYIFVLWSLLIFVSYNVLTVEASQEKTGFLREDYDWDEFYDDNISRENVDVKCDASEDYEANEKACKKAYQKIEKQEQDSIKHIEAGIEKAAQEDAICDNEDADSTDVKLCMSEDRKQKKNEREWYYNENTGSYEYLSDKEIKDHNMESESGIMQGEKWGPETPIEPPSEPYPTAEVIEDWGNTVTDEEQQRYQEEQEYQQAKYEQLAHQYTEEEQKEMNNALEEASEEDEPEEQEEDSEEESDDGGDESSEEDNE